MQGDTTWYGGNPSCASGAFACCSRLRRYASVAKLSRLVAAATSRIFFCHTCGEGGSWTIPWRAGAESPARAGLSCLESYTLFYRTAPHLPPGECVARVLKGVWRGNLLKGQTFKAMLYIAKGHRPVSVVGFDLDKHSTELQTHLSLASRLYRAQESFRGENLPKRNRCLVAQSLVSQGSCLQPS